MDHSHHSSDPDLGRRGTLVLTHDSRQALLHRVGSDLSERLVQVPGEQADPVVQGMDVESWRDVVRNNPSVSHVQLAFQTEHDWLPHFLVEQGFFDSTSRIKKNRPDLWRSVEDGDWFELSWAEVWVNRALCV